MKHIWHYRPLSVNWRTCSLLMGICALLLTGCVKKTVQIAPDQRSLPVKLTMSRAEILQELKERSKAIQTLSSTVTLALSGGEVKSGGASRTELHPVDGIILARLPNDIQIVGRTPLVGTRLFEMVSDGSRYRLSITAPTKKGQWAEGSVNSSVAENESALVKLPSDILRGLFISILPYVDNPDVHSVLEEAVLQQRPYYILAFNSVDKVAGEDHLTEKFWIDRSTTDFEVARKTIFEQDGKVQTDARFLKYQPMGPVSFPTEIQMDFPLVDCSVKITFDQAKVKLNSELSTEAFHLERPEDAVPLDQAGRKAASKGCDGL